MELEIITFDNEEYINFNRYAITRYTPEKIKKSLFLLPKFGEIENRLFLLAGEYHKGSPVVLLRNGNLADYLNFIFPVLDTLGTTEKSLFYLFTRESNSFQRKISEKMLSDYCKIALLPSECLHLIAMKGMLLKDSLLFTLFDENDLFQLIELINHFNFTVSQIRILCETLIELEKRDGMKVRDRINLLQTEPDSVSSLNRLFQLKNPAYSQVNQEFSRYLDELSLPASVKISSSFGFESKDLSLSLKCRSQKEFEKTVSQIYSALESGKFTKIFYLLENI